MWVYGGLAMDKKISELTLAQSIDPADVSILVSNNTDYQYSFTTLLAFIGNNLTTGVSVTFGTTLPQNTSGRNGDIFVNTAIGAFAQKVSGIWTIVYTLPSPDSVADGTLLYGLGTPDNTTGKNGDTYINTGTGIFYKKSAGAWSLVFSMLNGPAGVKGDKGDKGDAGNNGKTILSGTSNPSNLTDGTDGDFYINTGSWTLFGPKTAGVWGNSAPLVQNPENIKTVFTALAAPLTINWQTDDSGFYALKHGDNPSYQEINKGDNGKWTINGIPNIQETRDDTAQLITVILTPSVPGQTNFIII